MMVNLHIERLVVDGLPLASREGPRIESAVAAELNRLIVERGLADRLGRGGRQPLIHAAPIARPAGDGDGLGVQIGRAVYGGIGR